MAQSCYCPSASEGTKQITGTSPQQAQQCTDYVHIYGYVDGILPKGSYPPCLRMADRALLAGYPWCTVVMIMGCSLPRIIWWWLWQISIRKQFAKIVIYQCCITFNVVNMVLWAKMLPIWQVLLNSKFKALWDTTNALVCVSLYNLWQGFLLHLVFSSHPFVHFTKRHVIDKNTRLYFHAAHKAVSTRTPCNSQGLWTIFVPSYSDHHHEMYGLTAYHTEARNLMDIAFVLHCTCYK